MRVSDFVFYCCWCRNERLPYYCAALNSTSVDRIIERGEDVNDVDGWVPGACCCCCAGLVFLLRLELRLFFLVSCFNLFRLLCCAEQLFVVCECALFVRVLPLVRGCLVQGSDDEVSLLLMQVWTGSYSLGSAIWPFG